MAVCVLTMCTYVCVCLLMRVYLCMCHAVYMLTFSGTCHGSTLYLWTHAACGLMLTENNINNSRLGISSH